MEKGEKTKKKRKRKQWIGGVGVLDSAADTAAYNDFLHPPTPPLAP